MTAHGDGRTVRAFMSDRDARGSFILRDGNDHHWRDEAEREARRILAETERRDDGWTVYVPLRARGTICVGGPWEADRQRYRYNVTLPVGTAELADALAAFVAEEEA